MGIVDYLSREPNGDPWPESELDERFVVASIEDFHKALDCLNSRLIDTDRIDHVKILEHSGIRNNISHCKTTRHTVAIATNLFKTRQSSIGTKTVKTHVLK